MKHSFVLIGFMLMAFLAKAQIQKELTIGDTLYFNNCSGNNYLYIDLYLKTRWEDTTLTYDKNTGTGFYEYFFSKGDFDVARMPCSYKGSFAVISAAQQVPKQDGTTRLVVLAIIEKDKRVAWLEIEQAFENDELEVR
jgi:hypothetical protein